MEVNEIAPFLVSVQRLQMGWRRDPGGGEKAEDSLEVEEVLCRKADTAQPTSSRHRAPSISHESPMFFQTETTEIQVNLAWRQQARLGAEDPAEPAPQGEARRVDGCSGHEAGTRLPQHGSTGRTGIRLKVPSTRQLQLREGLPSAAGTEGTAPSFAMRVRLHIEAMNSQRKMAVM